MHVTFYYLQVPKVEYLLKSSTSFCRNNMSIVTSCKAKLDQEYDFRVRGLDRRFDELGLHGGTHYGISGEQENSFSKLFFLGGPYNEGHKQLRKTWHQTWLKLMNRSEIDELVSNSGQQLIENIARAEILLLDYV